MIIRPATFTDLPWLRALHAAFVAEYNTPYPTCNDEDLDAFVLCLAKALKGDNSFCMIVAEEDNKLVGYLGVGIMVRFIGHPREVFSPHWFYVVPSHRGQGIGRRIVAQMLAWAREHWPNVTEIELAGAPDHNQWIQRGFVPFLTYAHGPLSLADAFVTGSIPAHTNGAPTMTETPAPVIEEEDNG